MKIGAIFNPKFIKALVLDLILLFMAIKVMELALGVQMSFWLEVAQMGVYAVLHIAAETLISDAG